MMDYDPRTESPSQFLAQRCHRCGKVCQKRWNYWFYFNAIPVCEICKSLIENGAAEFDDSWYYHSIYQTAIEHNRKAIY